MKDRLRRLAGQLRVGLLDFFTAPTTGESAALFRIVFGVLSIWTTLGVGLNLERYWSGDGGMPWSAIESGASAHWSLLAIAPMDDRWLLAVFVLLAVASLTFTIGLFPRASAIAIWMVHVSLQNRNPHTVNGGDRLYLILALLAVFLPLHHKWSVHSLWRARRGRPAPPPASMWSVRLVQLQIAFVYVSTGLVKLQHWRWLNGHAMRDVLSTPVYDEWPTYLSFWPLVYFLTWFTLAFEVFGFPALVWFRRTRKIALAWGLVFHLGIEVLMVIPMFSVIMVVSYTLFVTDAEAAALVAQVFRRRDRPADPIPAPSP